MPKPKRTGRPKGSTKEDTLARIIPAARQLFAHKGYAQTTFKDVGAEVGISHAALYTYFTSKKELYLTTFRETQALLLPHFLAAFTEGKTLRERIRMALLAVATEHEKDTTITGFLAAVPIEIRRHDEIHEALTVDNNPVMNVLESIVEDAKTNGEIVMDITASELIGAILGGGIGVALLQYGLHNPDIKSSMEVFVSIIEARLFSEPVQ